MTWKTGAPVLVFLAGALLSRTIDFDSPPTGAAAVPKTTVTAQPAPAMVDGLRTFEVVQPPAREIRRNLFAFTEAADPVRPRVVHAVAPKTEDPPVQIVEKKPEPQTPREPEFPMQFIGTFGMSNDPIAVFAANGDVVNAKVGDRLTSDFKLSSIGIESVEVSTSRGTTQRVALKR